MTDVFQKQKRSEIMALVRSFGNKTTELSMIKIFKGHGIRGWRRNANLFGKPDFVFRKERVAVFVDGCFWHGCPVHGNLPTSNVVFWEKKILRNIQRACIVDRYLKGKGWKVIRVWEHELSMQKRKYLLIRLRKKGLGIKRSDYKEEPEKGELPCH